MESPEKLVVYGLWKIKIFSNSPTEYGLIRIIANWIDVYSP
jgi:hypothetical protein